MKKLTELRQALDAAEEAATAARDALTEYVTPIVIAAHGLGANPRLGYVNDIGVWDDYLRVDFRYEASGGPYDTALRTPVAIFNAEDPIAAGKAWNAENVQRKADAEKAAERAQLELLAKKLGVPLDSHITPE